MENNADFSNNSLSDNASNSSSAYLRRAAAAADAGDFLLSIHLYMAAFERSLQESLVPSQAVLEGMDRAWGLAITTRQRSLAEYIFEKLEPYWTDDQTENRAEELQRLAFDKLEEFGLPRDAIEEMADMMADGTFFGEAIGPEVLFSFDGVDGSGSVSSTPAAHSAHQSFSTTSTTPAAFATASSLDDEVDLVEAHEIESTEDVNGSSSSKEHAKTPSSDRSLSEALSSAENMANIAQSLLEDMVAKATEGAAGSSSSADAATGAGLDSAGSGVVTAGTDANANAHVSANAGAGAAGAGAAASAANINPLEMLSSLGITPVEIDAQALAQAAGLAPKDQTPQAPRVNFSNIVGYDHAIETMGRLGIGKNNDPQFQDFVAFLNQRHGVTKPPALGTVLFSGDAREDISFFMVSTVSEMQTPALRMRMDRNALGQSVLVVMASSDFKTRINNVVKNGFEAPAVLILEDLDLWEMPDFEPNFDDMSGFMQAQVSRGAREAMMLVAMALESPDVTVFISARDPQAIDPFFSDLISTYEHVVIDLPDEEERKALWRAAQEEHPSMRGLDVEKPVRYSRYLSRYDINYVVGESVDEAYRKSLEANRFIAVHTEDILLRLSNYQAPESEEYQEMESYVIDHFSQELNRLSSWEDLLS